MTTNPTSQRHSSSNTGARVTLVATLMVCIVGGWTAVVPLHTYGFGVVTELSTRPEALFIAVMRVVVFGLSLWIGIATLLAVGLQLAGLPRAAARVASYLPFAMRATLRRAVGIGIAGTLFLQTTAGAATPPAPGAPPSSRTQAALTASTASTASPTPQRQMRVDPATGQRWPVFTEAELRTAHVSSISLTVDFAPKDGQATPLTSSSALPTSTPVTPQPYVPQSTIAPAELADPTDPGAEQQNVAAAADTAAVEFSEPLRQHTVAPGEHFWSIARTEVQRAHPAASETDVSRYARLLIGANQVRLIDPANPDLLMIGTILELPPVAS